jgi:hypothetical protein
VIALVDLNVSGEGQPRQGDAIGDRLLEDPGRDFPAASAEDARRREVQGTETRARHACNYGKRGAADSAAATAG